MKNKWFSIITLTVLIGFTMAACGEAGNGGGGGGDGGDGDGDPDLPGTTVITPPQLPGTVTITFDGSDDGNITVTGTTLTANYTKAGNENTANLSYRWTKNGDTYVGTGGTAKTYTPTQGGVYAVTVTVIGSGSSKTSDPVMVRSTETKLTREKWYEILNEIRYGFPDSFDGILDLSKYECSDSANETAGLTSAGELNFYEPYISAYDDTKAKVIEITLPDAATSLKSGNTFSGVFEDFSNLEKVSGANITVIGNNAFSDSSKLTTVDLPKATTIGKASFLFTSITSVDFDDVTTVGDEAFSNCTSLVSVELPEATSIGNSAFDNCTNLETVNLPKVNTIGYTIFIDCKKLEEVTIGKITNIEAKTFNTLSINSVYSGLDSIKKVILPEVTAINDNAFINCASLESVEIPKAIIIGKYAFKNCSSLESVEFEDVTTIGVEAFLNCTSLVSAIFPNATNIGENYAFDGCTSLVTVELPKATELGYSVFSGCTSLVNVELPEAITLKGYTFSGCTNLVSVKLPKVTDLAHITFSNCTSLTDITLGPTAPKIGVQDFSGITTAKTVTIKIPTGASGYGGTGTYAETTSSTNNFTVNWANGFRGAGWDGTNFTPSTSSISSLINGNITIIIQEGT
jgi:hypothetical protein